MELNQLAVEYRQSGELCRSRALQLDSDMREKLSLKAIGATGIMRQKKRIIALKAMARECFATASYLETYYDRSISFDRYF